MWATWKGSKYAVSLGRSAPIGHSLRDQLRVRHNNRDTLVGNDGRRACADLADFAHNTADFDAIADLQWALEQQDEAAEKIARNILKPGPKSDPNRTNKHVERGEVDAGALQNHERTQADDDVARDGAKRLA